LTESADDLVVAVPKPNQKPNEGDIYKPVLPRESWKILLLMQLSGLQHLFRKNDENPMILWLFPSAGMTFNAKFV
jgi:hypothetical protein